QALHDDGILRSRGCLTQHFGASRGGLARHIEQVLDGHNAPIQRPKANACCRTRIGCLCGSQRGICIDTGEDAQSFSTCLCNSLQRLLGTLQSSHGAGTHCASVAGAGTGAGAVTTSTSVLVTTSMRCMEAGSILSSQPAPHARAKPSTTISSAHSQRLA